MKIVMLAVVALASTAFADSYVCTSTDRDIRVKANDSVLVLSRPSVGQGRRTIATFRTEDDVLSVWGRVDQGRGKQYEAEVDLRRIGSRRGGELILGTRLDQVDTVKLTVRERADGEYTGTVNLTKRNGETTWAAVDCN